METSVMEMTSIATEEVTTQLGKKGRNLFLLGLLI